MDGDAYVPGADLSQEVRKILGRLAMLERSQLGFQEQGERQAQSLDRVFRQVERAQGAIDAWQEERGRLVEVLERHNRLIVESQLAYRTLSQTVVNAFGKLRGEMAESERQASSRHTKFLEMVQSIQQQQLQITAALQGQIAVDANIRGEIGAHRVSEGWLVRGLAIASAASGALALWAWSRWDASDWVWLRSLGDRWFSGGNP